MSIVMADLSMLVALPMGALVRIVSQPTSTLRERVKGDTDNRSSVIVEKSSVT